MWTRGRGGEQVISNDAKQVITVSLQESLSFDAGTIDSKNYRGPMRGRIPIVALGKERGVGRITIPRRARNPNACIVDHLTTADGYGETEQLPVGDAGSEQIAVDSAADLELHPGD